MSQDEGPISANVKSASTPKKWGAKARAWLRAWHRDVGYLLVGLTVVYAVSGIAINHIDDWDPNFKAYEKTRRIAPIAADVPDPIAIATAQVALGQKNAPRASLRAGDEIHLEYDNFKYVVYGETGEVFEQGREPRFFLRVANWLHLNRGKAAWTYIADGYAVLLLFLAGSGLFMIKGRQGIWGRGMVLAAVGAAVPIIYVTMSSP